MDGSNCAGFAERDRWGGRSDAQQNELPDEIKRLSDADSVGGQQQHRVRGRDMERLFAAIMIDEQLISSDVQLGDAVVHGRQQRDAGSSDEAN